MLECTKSTKEIGTKLEDYAEKLNEVKGDYQTKESEFKTHKVKLKEVEVNIEALKTEYEEAKSQLDEIKVIFFSHFTFY
jgi:chromosome segregation ATPase